MHKSLLRKPFFIIDPIFTKSYAYQILPTKYMNCVTRVGWIKTISRTVVQPDVKVIVANIKICTNIRDITPML